jgi:hypothetical protein
MKDDSVCLRDSIFELINEEPNFDADEYITDNASFA